MHVRQGYGIERREICVFAVWLRRYAGVDARTTTPLERRAKVAMRKNRKPTHWAVGNVLVNPS
jgi:hypothetical protein